MVADPVGRVALDRVAPEITQCGPGIEEPRRVRGDLGDRVSTLGVGQRERRREPRRVGGIGRRKHG